jgi:hypothetical protein
MDDPLPAFVEAFNARDLDAMAALLATDATAQVLGAPFPEEQGAEMIRHTSLPHVCDPELGLVASRVIFEGRDWILLRIPGESGPIDTALSAAVEGGAIQRIEYVVAPHQPERLRALGAACDLPTAADA